MQKKAKMPKKNASPSKKNANNTKMPKPEKPRWHLRYLMMLRLGTEDAKTTKKNKYSKDSQRSPKTAKDGQTLPKIPKDCQSYQNIAKNFQR